MEQSSLQWPMDSVAGDRVEWVAIVAGIGRGERAAESRLVARFDRWLYVLLLRRSGDAEEAGDLTQDTLRIAIERLRKGELREPAALAAFLRSTAINLLVEHRRRDQRQRTTPDTAQIESLIDPLANPFRQLSESQLIALVRRTIQELGAPRDREILWRHYVLDEDKSMLCGHFALDSAHFDRIISRARQRLREVLQASLARDEMLDE